MKTDRWRRKVQTNDFSCNRGRARWILECLPAFGIWMKDIYGGMGREKPCSLVRDKESNLID